MPVRARETGRRLFDIGAIEDVGVVSSVVRMPMVLRARARDRLFARRPGTYALAVVGIFRNESPFLDEWIRFHIGNGIDHFYLYNNFSDDAYAPVLAPYIARGLVTLTDWPVETGQLPAYRHCVAEHAMDCRWMAFIDVDEFLFSPSGRPLPEVLSRYREHPAVVVHSPYFGSSGVEQRPPVPITRAFTRRAGLGRISAKTIANPRWIYAIRNVHLFKYWGGTAVAEDGRPFDTSRVCLNELRLNHYWSRSLADLREKIARGDASTPQKRDPDWHFAFEKELNAEEDTSILPQLERVFGPAAGQPTN